MIRLLDHKNEKTAEKVIALQKASYRVEADIIGFDLIPPLLEYPEDIMNSKETYLGYYIENTLAGILSYVIEDDVLDIYKVAVHPSFFKRGIGTKLIQYVERMEGINKLIVATGLNNTPAVNLYKSLGFKELEISEVEKGVHIISFEKLL